MLVIIRSAIETAGDTHPAERPSMVPDPFWKHLINLEREQKKLAQLLVPLDGFEDA
jgi:hypothetical protein